MSHLLQMRGLKPMLLILPVNLHFVASFTDAWIETRCAGFKWKGIGSHLLQMRGLKLNLKIRLRKPVKSHLLQMRGLKQTDKNAYPP